MGLVRVAVMVRGRVNRVVVRGGVRVGVKVTR